MADLSLRVLEGKLPESLILFFLFSSQSDARDTDHGGVGLATGLDCLQSVPCIPDLVWTLKTVARKELQQ